MNFLLSLLNRELSNFHIKETLAASLRHRWTASITTLACRALYCQVKWGGLERKHCDALTVDLIIAVATEWLVGGTLWTKDDDPRPGEDGAGWCKISSYFSEQLTVENLWIVCFWNFPFNIFGPQLTSGNWKHGKQNCRQGGNDCKYF